MALAFTPKTPRGERIRLFGNTELVVGEVTFDASYATGGLAVAASLFGADKVWYVAAGPAVTPVGKYAVYDVANAKLKLFVEGAAIFAEAANASDQSACVVPVVAIVEKAE